MPENPQSEIKFFSDLYIKRFDASFGRTEKQIISKTFNKIIAGRILLWVNDAN